MGLGRWWRRLKYLASASRMEAELREEMEAHRAMCEDQYRAGGLSASAARSAAARRMGNLQSDAEEARGIWVARWLESVLQDLGFALRGLRRQPLVTVTAVAALALGIGVNTSMFTVLNALLLRPWDVKEPERVVSVLAIKQERGGPLRHGGMPHAIFANLRERASAFEGIAAIRTTGQKHLFMAPNVAAGRVDVGHVSAQYFSLLGATPAWGRFFLPEEDRTGDPTPVAVLSHDFWRSRLGGDRSVIGSAVSINYKHFVVVGIASESFRGTEPMAIDVWLPMGALPLLGENPEMLTNAGWCCVNVVGRLRRETTRESAAAELSSFYRSVAAVEGTEGEGVFLAEPRYLNSPDRQKRMLPALLALWLAVLLVTLVACANVANLLLARGAARRRELATRMSLGAGRMRVVRQLLVESGVLSTLGAAIGLALAYFLPDAVMLFVTEERLAAPLAPDWRVALYALSLCGVAALASGLLPAFHSAEGGLAESMRSGSESARGRRWARPLFLGAQVALSAVLLTGAGLMLRGLMRAYQIQPGMQTSNTASIDADLRLLGYDAAASRAFVENWSSRAAAIPDVQSVAHSVLAPLGRVRMTTSVDSGEVVEELRKRGLENVLYNEVSANYFSTLKIPVISGGFQVGDKPGEAAIVNESFARRFWPVGNALGQPFKAEGNRRVAGICRDVPARIGTPPEPAFYILSEPGPDSKLIIRTKGSPEKAAAAALALARQLDERARPEFRTIAQNIDEQLSGTRASTGIVAVLGLFAMLLAAIGIYGVAAFAAQRRTREIGIRMALGARRREVIGLLVRDGLRAAAAGFAVGLAGAVALSRVISGFLYGVSPLDPPAYAGVGLLMGGCALLATYLPARKATAANPVAALRYE